MISIYIRIYKAMTQSGQITYYMKIAIDINKKVGGTRAYQAQANGRDRFIVIRDQINKNFHFIKSKLEEREKLKDKDASKINSEIRQKIEEIYSQLERMRESVAAEKGVTQAAKNVKYDLIEKLANQTKELTQLLDTSTDLDQKLFKRNQNETYTEMREQLLQPGKQKNNRIISKQNKIDAPTEMEMTKMKEWQKIDKEIDEQVGEVIEGIKRWKNNLLITGELIQKGDKMIEQLTADVDKVNQNLFQSNKKLKGIVQKMRKPHKFCIDIVLILILVALIVAIVKISSS